MSTDKRHFADTPAARLIALALAIGLGWTMVTTWGDEMRALTQGTAPEIPLAADTPDLNPLPAALQDCLTARVGDVDRMLEDGLITDSQHASFRDRAVNLCRVQNPA